VWRSRLRPVVRWTWAAAFASLGCWFVTLMFAHWWAAGGPPSDWPEWHEAWGNIFGAAVLASWAAAAFGVWFMRPRRRGPAKGNRP
jgi:hypothetical protein